VLVDAITIGGPEVYENKKRRFFKIWALLMITKQRMYPERAQYQRPWECLPPCVCERPRLRSTARVEPLEGTTIEVLHARPRGFFPILQGLDGTPGARPAEGRFYLGRNGVVFICLEHSTIPPTPIPT